MENTSLTASKNLVAQYSDNLLLVGINYDRGQKKHECYIERQKS